MDAFAVVLEYSAIVLSYFYAPPSPAPPALGHNYHQCHPYHDFLPTELGLNHESKPLKVISFLLDT